MTGKQSIRERWRVAWNEIGEARSRIIFIEGIVIFALAIIAYEAHTIGLDAEIGYVGVGLALLTTTLSSLEFARTGRKLEGIQEKIVALENLVRDTKIEVRELQRQNSPKQPWEK